MYKIKLNLLGQKFGRLTVTSPAKNRNTHTQWNCLCTCGKEVTVDTISLRQGHTQSCGCLREEQRKRRCITHGLSARGKQTLEYKLYHSAKRRAKMQGVPFTLKLSDIIIPEFCPVFPTIRLNKENKGIARFNSPSIDKLVPVLGYTPDNIRIISYRANTIKQDATPTELRQVAEWLSQELTK